MKKAILIKQKKGWRLEGEKTLNVFGEYGLTDDMDGKEVEFDNTGGPVKMIRYEGKEYRKRQEAQRPQNRNTRRPGYQERNDRRRVERNPDFRRLPPARAPYNFIPLNKTIVESQAAAPFDVFQTGRHSGCIDLDITAITDIFIRGQIEKFFSVNGKFAIPGSTLRGIVRSMTEIMSHSAMEFVDKKKRLFYRNIRNNFYKDKFLEINHGTVHQKSKAGWLFRKGNKYWLEEAPAFYKVHMNALSTSGPDGDKTIYHHEEIWFDKSKIKPDHVKKIPTRNGVRTFKLRYNIATEVSHTSKAGYDKGTLLITGLFARTKHFQWIIAQPNGGRTHPVSSVMEAYEMDESRVKEADLVKALNNAGGKPVPCFFIPDADGKPIAIGHTGIFRYPYQYKVGHAVKQDSIDGVDMAQRIFGFASTEDRDSEILAGKVFFEDAYATSKPEKEFSALRILSSPKPTSFQLYLNQRSGNELHHWGTADHIISGYKLYWHSRATWENPDPEEVIKAKTQREVVLKLLEKKDDQQGIQHTYAEVLKSGVSFRGCIRFENLTDEELGAILFALDLGEECAHKVGMGKPIGMGSVKIRPTLSLIDREARYRQLFSADFSTWHTGEERTTDLKKYKDAFAKYIGKEIDRAEIMDTESYWNTSRMKELKTMLTHTHNPQGVSWENRTRYMEIERKTNNHPKKNEYKDQAPLPKPSEVVKNETYSNP